MLSELESSLSYHPEEETLLVSYNTVQVLIYGFSLYHLVFNLKFFSISERGNESRRSISSRTLSSRVGSINEANPNRKRGMVLPFEPLSITFDEIRYAVDMPQVSIYLLALLKKSSTYEGAFIFIFLGLIC